MLQLSTLLLLSGFGCSDKGADSSETTTDDSGTKVTDSTPPTDDTETGGDISTTVDTGPVGELTPAITLTGPHPRNVIIISVDTLRTDHVNWFGYPTRVTTPTIDGFFENGLSFSNHYSCSSWTFPSMLCALTGMDQQALGFWPNNSTAGGNPGAAPRSIDFLAEHFDDRGYHTMLSSGSGFLGGAESDTSQGFDVGSGTFDVPTPTLIEDGLRYLSNHLDEDPDVPWMLHLHLMDPHAPYTVPQEYLGELKDLPELENDLSTEEGVTSLWARFAGLGESAQAIALQHLLIHYDASIRYSDDQLALFLADVDKLGALDDTLIVFFVDHGEEFFEHENFNHGYTAFEEVTRAPLAFYLPGNLEPHSLESLTTHEDLVPTLFTIMGWELEDSFTGAAAGTVERDALFNLSWREDKTIQSVTDGQEKLIYRWGETVTVGGGESGVTLGPETQKLMYDMPADRLEQDNLYDSEDPRVQRLWEELLPVVEALDAAEDSRSPENVGP